MKGKILVVDDDPQILDVLDIRLTGLGLEVTATSNPAHAVEIAAASRLDAALVDLRMGPPDGMVLTEALHEYQPHLPVLIMTGHATIESAVQAIQRGAFDYLTKPFIPDELHGKIARALAVRRWARDRERLLAIGEILASSGNLALVLDAVARAAMEAIEAARCVVFQREESGSLPWPAWAFPGRPGSPSRAPPRGPWTRVCRLTCPGPTEDCSWPRRWSCSAGRPARW